MIKNLRGEIWKPISGFAPYYRVSNKGRIKTVAFVDKRGWQRKEKLLKIRDAQLDLLDDTGTRVWVALAALVLTTFVGPKPQHCRLSRHLDDDRSNNCVENLAWGTDQDNHNDALRNGANFVSYGHRGHPHTDEAKAKISARFLGKPTGRKITPEHRAALLDGYRKKFPERQSHLCACGCGVFAKPGKRFIHGHHARLKEYQDKAHAWERRRG